MRRDEADPKQFVATQLVLTEVAEILTDFEGAVIAGGTAPYLLVPQQREAHEGTVDVDVVLDPKRFRSESDLTLHEVLERNLFVQHVQKPFRYSKSIDVRDATQVVLVEFITGGNPPPGGMFWIEREDVYVTVIKGMELALDEPVSTLVGGMSVSVTSMPSFLAMKAFALESREQSLKAKDAYDIVYCLRNYPGGVGAIASEIIARLPNVLLEEGLATLSRLFADIRAVGPTAYATRASFAEEELLMQREAYERVSDLLDLIP